MKARRPWRLGGSARSSSVQWRDPARCSVDRGHPCCAHGVSGGEDGGEEGPCAVRAIKGDGGARVPEATHVVILRCAACRYTEAKRVQKCVETLDVLKVSNARPQTVIVTTKWERSRRQRRRSGSWSTEGGRVSVVGLIFYTSRRAIVRPRVLRCLPAKSSQIGRPMPTVRLHGRCRRKAICRTEFHVITRIGVHIQLHQHKMIKILDTLASRLCTRDIVSLRTTIHELSVCCKISLLFRQASGRWIY